MKLGTFIKASFLVSLILTIAAVYLKLIHADGADTWLIAGLVASLIFIATAIYEVWSSKRIDSSQKTIWTVILIFFSSIAGLLYILVGRKNIAS